MLKRPGFAHDGVEERVQLHGGVRCKKEGGEGGRERRSEECQCEL